MTRSRIPRRRRWAVIAAAALLSVPLTPMPSEAAAFTVINTNDTGTGSLRWAIDQANASSATDTIEFNIPGDGPHTIQPASALPSILQPMLIDGYTQPGASENTLAEGSNAVLMIEIDGTNTGTAVLNLANLGPGGITVRGLVINRFGAMAFRIAAGSGNVVEGNFIGTDVGGTAALGGAGVGVHFSGNASNHTIGGTTPAARNLISGNGSHGVFMLGSNVTGNVVAGNLIGTNAAGDAALGNDGHGVRIDDASGNVVGGTAAGAGNVISGHGPSGTPGPATAGVWISGSDATDNVVQGNLIGTNAVGDAALPNLLGTVIESAPGNTIGGAAAGAGNVISGNGIVGVAIVPLLGGSGTSDATGNVVQGNLIGTTAAGDAALANSNGALILGSANNTVGGTTPEAANVIAGSADDGIVIAGEPGAPAFGNVLQGNFIGTNPASQAGLGNNGRGVVVRSASGNTVGGTDPGAGNVIARNVLAGVVVGEMEGSTAVSNPILGNSIFDNGGLGIDLGDDGVTENDPKDADDGPNRLQNYPVLTAAAVGSTTVEGTLHSLPNSTFRVEFFASPTCDSSGHGEGRDFLGATEVTTDPEGDVAFTTTLAATAGVQQATATATRIVAGMLTDTSEFSNCVEIEGVDPEPEPEPGEACPPDEVPPSGFTDIAANVHEAAIDCVAWHGIARGVTPEHYGPGLPVRRDQMASFIARMLETAGYVFPPASDQGFTDIAGNVHAERINQLAEAGIVQGVTATSYAPDLAVRRDQMASFLVRAYEFLAGVLPDPPPSGFPDTAGNVHEVNIDKAAAAGFALGTTPTTFEPAAAVRRDQMASFITRVLERLAAEGFLE